MQKYQSVYGLFVECRDDDHNEYMDFKDKFEKFFSHMQSMINQHSRNDVVFHFIALPEKDKWLTFCAAHNNLYLGIYDRATHDIQMNCKFEELRHLGKSDYMLIANRMSNMLSAKVPVTRNDTQLNKAWGRHIVRIKCMDDKTKIGGKDNKGSLFTRSFSENCRMAYKEAQMTGSTSRINQKYQER